MVNGAGAGRSEADARFDAMVAPGGAGAHPTSAAHPVGPASARPASAPRRPSTRGRQGTTIVAMCGLLTAAGVIAASLFITSGGFSLARGGEKLTGATTALGDDKAAVAVDSVADGAASVSKKSADAARPTTAALGSAAMLSSTTSVFVSRASGFEPSRKAAGVSQAESLVYTVTITNVGKDEATPSVFVSAASGGAAASPITDAVNGLRVGVAAQPLEGGASRTYRVAFSAANSAAAVTVSSGSASVTFS